MLIELDPHSPDPLFQQIHDRIVEAIAHARLTDGTRLDPVRRVAADFGINPATVKKAYDLLQDEGIIITEPRLGSVVHVAHTFTPENEAHLLRDLSRTIARAHVQGCSAHTIRSLVDELLAQFTPSTPPSAQK